MHRSGGDRTDMAERLRALARVSTGYPLVDVGRRVSEQLPVGKALAERAVDLAEVSLKCIEEEGWKVFFRRAVGKLAPSRTGKRRRRVPEQEGPPTLDWLPDGYVLLTGPQVRVERKSLLALVDILQTDAGVGVVGAKVLNPEMRVVEAGRIVFSDGSTLPYGAGADPDDPAVTYARDVDACAAGCMLLRKQILDEAGSRADLDLAFAARSLGYRVRYQPRAEAYFLGDPGTLGTGNLLRWRERLAREHLPAGTHPIRARERASGKQLLVIDAHTPDPTRGGGEMRMVTMLQLFKELGHAVTFLPADGTRGDHAGRLETLGVEVIPSTSYLDARGAFIDCAVLSRPEVAQRYLPLVRQVAPRATVIYDTVDLHWVREQRRAEVENSEAARRRAERFKTLELLAAAAADVTLVVTPVEKAILDEAVPEAQVRVVPTIHPVQGRRTAFADRHDLLFVGHYTHTPNRDGMLFFLDEIFPSLRLRLPGVRVHIVGPDPGAGLLARATEDVLVTGWVRDLDPLFERCRVFVCPLRYGAGMKSKIGQSMSYGLPVVTTTIGAEGMALLDGDSCLIADAPAAFAEQVVRLYGDEGLWTKLSERGLKTVRTRYSPEVVRQELAGLLECSTARPVPPSGNERQRS